MVKSFVTKGPSQTRKLGEKLARDVLTKKPCTRGFVTVRGMPKKAVIVGLVGELGSGKTTFLQGFSKGLGIKERILSPTFVIMKKFQVSSSKFQGFYHIDCYRVQKPKEILALDLKEIISNHRDIVAIEWADRIEKILPKNAIQIKFEFAGKNKRKISLKGA